jgi:GxxExxY protein
VFPEVSVNRRVRKEGAKNAEMELKSVEEINEVHLAQTLTYMKLGNYRLGLLVNFNVKTLKEGIRRVVNNL